jgi:hypothetical protein
MYEEREYDVDDDVFSFGLILYEVIAHELLTF